MGKEVQHTVWHGVTGLLLLALSILLLLSQLSYDPGDIGVNQWPPNQPALNSIGPFGAWFSFISFSIAGIVAYLLPLGLAVQGCFMLFRRHTRSWPKALWMSLGAFALIVFVELQEMWWHGASTRLNLFSTGGLVGQLLVQGVLVQFLGHMGTAIVGTAALLVALLAVFEAHPVSFFEAVAAVFRKLTARIQQRVSARRERKEDLATEQKEIARQRKQLERTLARQKKEEEKTARKQQKKVEKEKPVVTLPPDPPPPPKKPAPPPKKKETDTTEGLDVQVDASTGDYILPPLDLLDAVPVHRERPVKDDLQGSAQILQDTLAEFGVDAQVTNVEQGPVVTRYELLPAPGIRVEKISGLSNNLALALKAESIRIQAPIPGKGVVGIEIPNSTSMVVYLRELMESSAWSDSEAALPLALGKDVGGRDLVADLAAMPHMLIAGATGSGKSVCINSILTGLLMSRTPDQMRMLLVDPKIVEFSVYNNLPHLVVPVVTDPKKVSLGLRWAINEMEKRYKMFAKVGVRNIKAFNSRPIVKQEELFGEEQQEAVSDKKEMPDRLPYIVIVIDELADLMAVAQAEIETSIARLAQLSRAVGIHMIIATQRPSVNVITGTIKANFPARIAFQVAQKVDSRTILDANGADKLLGRGDMLFLPPGSSKLIRSQGTMTKDHEITNVVKFIEDQGTPSYEPEIQQKIESKTTDLPEMDEDDDLLDSAIEVIRQTQRASTSSLQRRLRIGYTRAARLMDILEEKGVVGPPNGSEPREILVDLDGDIPQNEQDDSEMITG